MSTTWPCVSQVIAHELSLVVTVEHNAALPPAHGRPVMLSTLWNYRLNPEDTCCSC